MTKHTDFQKQNKFQHTNYLGCYSTAHVDNLRAHQLPLHSLTSSKFPGIFHSNVFLLHFRQCLAQSYPQYYSLLKSFFQKYQISVSLAHLPYSVLLLNLLLTAVLKPVGTWLLLGHQSILLSLVPSQAGPYAPSFELCLC